MNLEEEQILKEQLNNKQIEFDTSKKYSIEFYNSFIEHFDSHSKEKKFYYFIKRFLDIIISFLAIDILIIPFIVIGIIIKCDSKGPVFFKSKRIGKNGKEFCCLKFRSMTLDAPPDVASSNFHGASKYITKFGKFIRITSIDELPQLFNVFIGQMSIIGYRPLIPEEVKCNKMRESLGVFKLRPGISGYSQVHGRDEVYYKNKAIMDAYYVKNASFKTDVGLVFSSIKAVVTRKGNKDKE